MPPGRWREELLTPLFAHRLLSKLWAPGVTAPVSSGSLLPSSSSRVRQEIHKELMGPEKGPPTAPWHLLAWVLSWRPVVSSLVKFKDDALLSDKNITDFQKHLLTEKLSAGKMLF